MTDTTLIPVAASGSNLRPDENDPSSWRVCGVPRRLRSDPWLPLQRLWLPDVTLGLSSERGAETIFWSSEGTLGVSFLSDPFADPLAADVSAIAVLPASPLCLTVVTPGVIRVLLRHSAPVYITYTSAGVFTLRGPMPELPPLMFATVGSALLSEPLPVIPLSGAGIQGGTLPADDRRRVTAAFLSARSNLCAAASAAGWLIQPVIARYRLEDPNGDTLFLSPPVMLAADAGFQLTGETAQNLSPDLASASSGALQARGYALRLLPPASPLPEPWCSLVSRVVVEVSEQIDPVDPAGLCAVRVASSGSSATIHVSLPGACVTSASARRGLVERALRSSLGKMTVTAVIPAPFAATFSGAPVAPAPPVAGLAPSPVSLLTPWREGVSYGVASLAGGLLLCASPLTERFPGYSPAHFAVATTSGAWQAVAAVTVARPDGGEETAVTSAYGSSASTCTPAAFSGILSYPDPAARRMTLTLRAPDGSVSRQSFPLTPWPQAGIAYYIDPEGATAISLQGYASEIDVPLSSLSPRAEDGVVAVCDPSMPGAPLCREAVAEGPVAAILEAPRSAGNWDFSRRRIIVYGRGGTTLMTLSAKMALHSVARLDLRPVLFVTRATGEKGLTHLAIASGDLVEVSASGVTTVMRSCSATSCGRCASTGEYWLASPSLSPRRLLPSGELISLLAAPFPATSPGGDPVYPSLVNWCGRPLLSLPSSLHDPADEGPDLPILPTSESHSPQSIDPEMQRAGDVDIILPVPCAFSIRYRLSSRAGSTRSRAPHYPGRRLLSLTVPLISTAVSGTLTVSADNGASSSAAPLVTLSITGPLRSPLRLRIPAPVRSHLTLSFSGRLTPGSLLSPPHLASLPHPDVHY